MTLTHFAPFGLHTACGKGMINATTDPAKVTCAACFIATAQPAKPARKVYTRFAVVPITPAEDLTENMQDRVSLYSTDLEIETSLFDALTADYSQYGEEFTIASW